MRLFDAVHGKFVFGRRVNRLADHLADLIPKDVSVIDVGCGDGALGHRIMKTRPDIRLQGAEVMLRPKTHIPVEVFDGEVLPFGAGDYDVVLLVDVLHHLENPQVLLREASRVARSGVVIKDHLKEGLLADWTLRFMDQVGNARYRIPLPYTFWTRSHWQAGFEDAGLTVAEWRENLQLYPPPASWLFDRSLHFMALLIP